MVDPVQWPDSTTQVQYGLHSRWFVLVLRLIRHGCREPRDRDDDHLASNSVKIGVMQETTSIFKDGRTITTRLSKLGERPDREFDIQFWQGLSSEARANAVWELVVDYWEMKGKDSNELRLQRSVESVQRRRG